MSVMTHPSVLPDTSRAEMLAKGDLVDVSDEAYRLNFRHPVAVTREVWEDCIWWDDSIEEGKPGYTAQETQGRLRDVLWMALLAAKRTRSRRTYRTYFDVERVPVFGRGTQARPVTLAIKIGPGDNFEPVITIEFPEEG